jgi:fructokinase
MTTLPHIVIFGEVLFDCFPSGEQILGGAPFNVAWHLQALGDKPIFISQVGEDALGDCIKQAMTEWGMTTEHIGTSVNYSTGNVQVNIVNNEPDYTITPDSAYDFIQLSDKFKWPQQGILYHGTLALRNQVSRAALSQLRLASGYPVFLDVNLRSPWWDIDAIQEWLAHARWVKLNHHELSDLGFADNDIYKAMEHFQMQFNIDLLIVTQGEKGALILDRTSGFYSHKPNPVKLFVDTVGAGDAFTAMFIHGLRMNLAIPDILDKAQAFAASVIGLRGATTSHKDFYFPFIGD